MGDRFHGSVNDEEGGNFSLKRDVEESRLPRWFRILMIERGKPARRLVYKGGYSNYWK